MNPIVHSESSVKRWGGTIEDYLPLHEKMDCSKAWISDNRHRALTHTLFWVKEVMIPIFGSYIEITGGKKVSVKDICEQHILEDFKMKFIPTPQDFLQEMDFKDWMQNGRGICPSAAKLYPTIMPEVTPTGIEMRTLDVTEVFKEEEAKTENPNPPVLVLPEQPPKRRPPVRGLGSMILDGKRGGMGGYERQILD